MAESKPKPPAESGLETRPVKDLEPEQSQSENVRGGYAGGGKRFSDTMLKYDITRFASGLAKLREIRS